ncbi:MAG: glycosyltransferase family 2 protein [Gemmatimonadetes bacterium]|nr:glycosyltransferase family 2 protein [Gemmatimonadota bacterium]
MPCLDEAATVERCIRAAQRCIERHGLAAEIIVADNGSRDGSQAIAARAGARVVSVRDRGYGNALLGGFEAARGRWLIMGDTDESYDFAEAMPMIEALRAGADLVMGSRFKGRIERGAMPFLHRWPWCGRRTQPRATRARRPPARPGPPRRSA